MCMWDDDGEYIEGGQCDGCGRCGDCDVEDDDEDGG
jgi:hypothetical protein